MPVDGRCQPMQDKAGLLAAQLASFQQEVKQEEQQELTGLATESKRKREDNESVTNKRRKEGADDDDVAMPDKGEVSSINMYHDLGLSSSSSDSGSDSSEED